MRAARRSLMTLVILVAVASALPGLAHLAAADAAGAMVVIVNRSNTSPDPTFDDLRAMLNLERQFWKDGKRVVLLLPSAGSPARELMMKQIYHRSDDQLRKDWARRLFAGEIPAVPTSLRSVEALVGAVAHSPGGVSVVPASSALPASVRVLAVDGKRPGQTGYPLAAGAP